MIYTTRCHYDATPYERSLEGTIADIGYENILQILPCYCGCGECFYTIIYKDGERKGDE